MFWENAAKIGYYGLTLVFVLALVATGICFLKFRRSREGDLWTQTSSKWHLRTLRFAAAICATMLLWMACRWRLGHELGLLDWVMIVFCAAGLLILVVFYPKARRAERNWKHDPEPGD